MIILTVLMITVVIPHIIAYIVLEEVFNKEVESLSFIQFLEFVYFI